MVFVPPSHVWFAEKIRQVRRRRHQRSRVDECFSSAGYNAWRDTKKPAVILNELCRTRKLSSPVYSRDFRSLKIDDVRFDCDAECIDFVTRDKSVDLVYRKVHHESPEDYLRQNTALAALHGWPRKNQLGKTCIA